MAVCRQAADGASPASTDGETTPSAQERRCPIRREWWRARRCARAPETASPSPARRRRRSCPSRHKPVWHAARTTIAAETSSDDNSYAYNSDRSSRAAMQDETRQQRIRRISQSRGPQSGSPLHAADSASRRSRVASAPVSTSAPGMHGRQAARSRLAPRAAAGMPSGRSAPTSSTPMTRGCGCASASSAPLGAIAILFDSIR